MKREKIEAALKTVAASLKSSQFYRKYAAELVYVFILFFCYILLHRKYDWLPLLSLMLSGVIALWWCGKPGRALFLAGLGIVTVLERHFIIHYNESFQSIGTQALITLQITSKEEIGTYLSLLRPEEFILPLLFIGGIILICVRRKGFGKHSWWSLIALPLFLIAIYCNTAAPVRSYLKQWAVLKDIVMKRQAFQFHGEDVSREPRSLRILVIGESHREDYFEYLISPKYAPLLAAGKESGTLLDFTDMVSLYPQTWFAVFTKLTRRDGKDQAVYFPEKGLPTLFREAGYKVHYVTYQPRTPATTGYDYLIGECNTYTNSREVSGTMYDMGMIPILRKIAASEDPKVLIIIKMVGVHFKFHTRYPDHFKIYKPTFDESNFTSYTRDKLELMLNSYRNGMTYSGAYLNEVAKIVEDSRVPAMMCFLSDHGMTLFDDGENPIFGKAKGSYHIPFFFYGNAAYWTNLPEEKRKNLIAHREWPVSDLYLMETFASAAGVTYPGKRPKLDLTSSAAVPAEHRQVWGWNHLQDYDSLK